MIDTTYLSAYDLQTLAEDMSFEVEVVSQRPTIFFRPDDRTDPSFPTYWRADAAGVSYIGFITVYGSHAAKTPPSFKEPRIKVRVLSREVRKVSDVREVEYLKAYRDIRDAPGLCAYLRAKYPAFDCTASATVTVYGIEYLDA
jgi:hypothetical protein